MVFRALGASGKANGDVAQRSFILVPSRVTMHGHAVVPALGYSSPINVQMMSPTRAIATGDFAVLGERSIRCSMRWRTTTSAPLPCTLTSLASGPTIYFIHFWADGRPDDVLRGLRAAVDAAR